MSQIVEFPSNGGTAPGHLFLPESGSGPGVIVLQEWWGIEPSILDIAQRLSAEGFVALVPDLYRGELAEHYEMDKAGALMTALPPERAASDMSAAVDFLAEHPGVVGDGIGVIGFCMGGMLALLLAARRPDRIVAAVPFYGFPTGEMEPDWQPMTAAVQAHLAESDDFFPPSAGRALEAKLQAMGKEATFTVHAGTGHAFMAPHNALGTRDEEVAARVWPLAVAFLHDKLA